MATKLKTYDFSAPSKLTMSDKATYPWDEWLDGDIWQLVWGEDFDGHPLMMERIIRTRATGRRAKINLRHVPMNGEQWGIIILQRNDVVGPAALRKAEQAAKRQATKLNGSTPKAEVSKAEIPSKPTVNKAPAVKTPAAVKGASKKPQRALAAVS